MGNLGSINTNEANSQIAQCEEIPLNNAKRTTRHRKQRRHHTSQTLDTVQLQKHLCRGGIAFWQICGKNRAGRKRKDSTDKGLFFHHRVAILDLDLRKHLRQLCNQTGQ